MAENRQTFRESGPGEEAAQIYADLRKKTVDELVDEMADLWDSMDETTYDPEAMDAYLDVLEEKDPIAQNFDVEASLAEFWEKNGNPSEEAGTAPQVISSPRRARPQRMFRLIAVIVVLVALVASVAIAQAGGFSEFWVKPKDEGEQFRFEVNSPGGMESPEVSSDVEGKTYPTLQAALDDCGITTSLAPTWFPEEFAVSEVKVADLTNVVKLRASYVNDDRQISISISQYKSYAALESGKSGMFEKNKENVILYVKNKIEHYIMENSDCVKANWVNGTAIETISGNITKEEIIKIVDSVYE